MSPRPDPGRAAPLAEGADVELTLTDMAYGGDAVGRSDSGVVFAWGGIAGEQVTVRVDRVKRDVAWATVSAVAAPAAQRVTAPCPYFGPCGGCQWQHIDYAGQLDFKTAILRDQLRRFGGLDAERLAAVVRPALGMSDPWHYRNVAHFQVDPATRQLGYFRRKGQQVVPVEVCPISDPGINGMLTAVQALLASKAQAPGDLPPNIDEVDLEAIRRGQMPVSLRERKVTGMPVWQVTIRTGAPPEPPAAPEEPWAGRQMVVLFHTLSGEAPAPRRHRGAGGEAEEEPPRAAVLIPRKAVRQWAAGLAGQVSVVELRQDGALELIAETAAAGAAAGGDIARLVVPGRVSGSRRAAEIATEDPPEPPPGVLRQRLGGQRFWIAPQAFFQVNNAAAEIILDLVRAALPRPAHLLVDAYSGVGAFALALLGHGDVDRVVAIENDWPSVESARWTATLLELPAGRFEIRRGRVEDILPGLDLAPDVVLLDPPRAGCAPAVLRRLLSHPIPRLIYVSCDPSTLARDIRTLAAGYTLSSAQPVDLFPQTYHIETVAVLDRIAPL